MPSTDISIAVCVAHHNKGPLAMAAVRSVLEQQYRHAELILVDDGSTDGSDEPLVSLAAVEPRFKFKSLPLRMGAGAARNEALKMSTADYVFFLDSDDLMLPGALAYMAASVADAPSFDFMAFPMQLFYQTPGDMDVVSNIPKQRDDLLRFLERDQPWLLSGALWNRRFLEKLGGFTPGLISQQEYDLHVRALLCKPRYRYIHERPVCLYRQGVKSEARRLSQSLEGLRQRAAMLLSYLPGLQAAGLRTAETDRAMAAYLLDIAQMMRWHKEALLGESTREGLNIWMAAHTYQLCDARTYSRGMGYVRFKHNMIWNRLPGLQALLEARYRKVLAPLFSLPESTLCKCALNTLQAAPHGK